METDLAEAIGVRIARARRDAGLTQEALGEAMDPPVDAQTISRWERATREPSFSRLTQIAKVVGMSWAELIGAGPGDSRRYSRVLDVLRDLDDRELNGALHVLRAHVEAIRHQK